MVLNTKKRHKVIAASLLVPVSLLAAISPIIASELTYAACTAQDKTSCVDINMTIDEVLSITNLSEIEDEDLGTADGQVSISGGQAVKVKTNHGGGYKLIVKAISKDTSEVVTSKMLRRNSLGTALSDTGLESVSSRVLASNMAASTWGLGVNTSHTTDISSSDKYLRPIATTDAGVVNYTTTPTDEDVTNIYFGAKGDTSSVAGKYSAEIQITAIANDGSTPTIYGN